MTDEQLKDVDRGLHALFDIPGEVLRLAREGKTPPSPLYHFSDMDGVVGILSKKTIRASLATTLNDESEILYGIERARAVLASGTLDVDSSFAAMALETLDPSNTVRHVNIEWRVYLASFCAREDHALHWLHYGRNGTGIALGFDTEGLVLKGFDLLPVIYLPEQQDALLRRLFEEGWRAAKSALPTFAGAGKAGFMKLAAEIIGNYSWLAAPLMKSVAFASEQEWRLCTFEPKGLQAPPGLEVPMPTQFRTVAGRVVPYKDVSYEPLPVAEIVLGASAPIRIHDQGLAVLLEERLVSPLPAIKRSSVPVRP
jgi:hypothetical protein